MPTPKSWYRVSHELNKDPEVWELTTKHGDRSLRVWLEVLSIMDRHDNRMNVTPQQLASIAGIVRVHPGTVWKTFLYALDKCWIKVEETASDGSPKVISLVKYMKYHKSPGDKLNQKRSTPDLTRHDSLSEIKKSPTEKTLAHDGFEQFWECYPKNKRKSKGRAEKAYAKIKPTKELHDKMIDGLELAKKSHDWTKEDGRYIPHPATWLNGKCWEDEHTQQTGWLDRTLNREEPDA